MDGQSDAIEALVAKDEIREVIYAYCDAVDRHDYEYLKSLYHEDGFDDHGHFGSGPVDNFLSFVKGNADVGSISKVMHNTTNIQIWVEGGYAEAQSYVIALHVIPDESGTPYDLFFMGRYLDKFERRDDGVWKIHHRCLLVDMAYRTEGSVMTVNDPLATGMFQGANGPGDPKYDFFRLTRRGQRHG